jgi:hypothetical protein
MYTASESLEEYFVDNDTGLPLADGWVFFYQDNARNTLKYVYELTGSPPNYEVTQLPNPLRLSSVGTPVDADGNNVAIYYFPYDNMGNLQLYYVAVYSNDNGIPAAIPEFTRESWPPNTFASDAPGGSALQTPINELSNSQFVEVLFDPANPYVISWVGPINNSYLIAPDWSLNVTAIASGSVTIVRNAIAGLSNFPGNPPYTMTFTPSVGVSALSLTQTLFGNPGIWSQNTGVDGSGYVAGSIFVGAGSGSVSLNYQTSPVGVPEIIIPTIAMDVNNKVVNSTVLIFPSINTATPADGGVTNINVILDAVTPTTISSIQVMGLPANIPNIQYEQQPVNRQRDFLFHYYGPKLAYKPIPSYLIGWDFALNPAQFGGYTVPPKALGANSSYYAWDQTIIYQTVSNSVSVTNGNSGGLQLTATANTQFAIVQYLDAPTALAIANNQFLSVNIAGTAMGAPLNGTVSLWVTQNPLPLLAANQSIVSNLDANGYVIAQNGGPWVEIPRTYGGNAFFSLPISGTSAFVDIPLTGWSLSGNDIIPGVTFFAIVVGFATALTGNGVNLGSVSLVPGSVATRPAPISLDATLSACEQFYEMSYANGSLNTGATGSTANALVSTQLSTLPTGMPITSFLQATSFSFMYRNQKRTLTPTVNVYSVLTGTVNRVTCHLQQTATNGSADAVFSNYWIPSVNRNKSASFFSTSGANVFSYNFGSAYPATVYAYIHYHYTVDARLGLVI